MYLKNFHKAIERNLNLGLLTPKVSYEENRYLSSEFLNKLPLILYRELGAINPLELHKNCMGIHYRLKPIFEKSLNTEVYLTLGKVKVYDQHLFEIEENEIKNLLINKVQEPLNIHAWLTLPSMEIIDLTLATTYSIINKTEEGLGAAITKHYSELTHGMTYEPMLIGDDFLRKTGGIIELL